MTKSLVKNFIISIFLLSLLSLLSCSQKDTYFQYKILDKEYWDNNDVLAFELDSSVLKPNQEYVAYIEVTNTPIYPYKSLILDINYGTLVDQSDSADLSVAITDDFGQWKGGGFGSCFQTSTLVPFTIKLLDEEQKYYFRIKQNMTDKQLEGISRVGLRLVENSNISPVK